MTTQNSSTEQLATLEHKIRNDFRVFLTLVWRELDLPRPTRAQLAIADYLSLIHI